MTDVLHPTTTAAGALRRAATWCLVTAVAIVATPVTVFVIPWSTFGSQYDDPTVWRDPVATGALPWLGPVYGLQGLALAAAVVIAALALAEPLGRGQLALAGLAGAFGWSLLQLVIGGGSAAWYGTQLAAELADLQPDPSIRKLIGYGDLLSTQGLAGAAGLAALLWLAAVAVHGRRSGWFGRAPLIATIVIAALNLVAYVLGYAAAASLLVLIPFAVTGFALLAAARRA